VTAQMDDFGGKLRQARERRGISLRQIAASTKISAAALEALERNDISKLPGGIFSRAFVKSYAVEVGLDPDDTVKEFLDRFDQETPPSAASVAADVPEHEREFEEQRRKAALLVKGVIVAIPVLAIVLYFALRGRNPSHAQTASQPPPSAPPAAADAVPSATPAAAPPAAPAKDVSLPAEAPAQMTLDVHPTRACWVSLTIDGKKLFARIMQAGEHEAHPVTREAVVEVGDAGAFAFSVNGREGKPLGGEGQVKTLKFTPSTAAQYLR
jgi:cytoskeleton protein RodZ